MIAHRVRRGLSLLRLLKGKVFMAAFTWYLTDITRSSGSGPWTVNSSTQIDVWFGSTADWALVPPAQQATYELHILSDNDGLVDADEARLALTQYNGSYSFPGNFGYLGTLDIDPDGSGPSGLVPSVGLAVDGSALKIVAARGCSDA